jgi:hypothetical protein
VVKSLPLCLLVIASSVLAARHEDTYIWDGDAELIMRITVIDAATHAPIPGALVSFVRDRRVAHRLEAGNYPNPQPAQTDARGRATLKASFPAAGDPTGFSVFVRDSYVSIASPSYAPSRARISRIYRLDFARHTKNCLVPITMALKHT